MPAASSHVVPLFHHRWGAPVLAELHRQGGSKFITLVRRLGIGRESLQRTLRALIRRGWVKRNPGYGHPMRPEYVLTDKGERFGPACALLIAELQRLQAEQVGLNKWSMPLVLLMASGARRFSELRAAFPAMTARALALAVKDLQMAGLVARRVTEDYPPTTIYELREDGRKVADIVKQISALS